MNKEKIVGLSDRLNEIVDEANRHPKGTPGFITWDKAVYAIEALSKELNSKLIMPKCFDNWYKENKKTEKGSWTADWAINMLNSLYFEREGYGSFKLTEAESNFQEWLQVTSDAVAREKCEFGNTKRYLKAVTAITTGYEVSDDE